MSTSRLVWCRPRPGKLVNKLRMLLRLTTGGGMLCVSGQVVRELTVAGHVEASFEAAGALFRYGSGCGVIVALELDMAGMVQGVTARCS